MTTATMSEDIAELVRQERQLREKRDEVQSGDNGYAGSTYGHQVLRQVTAAHNRVTAQLAPALVETT